MNVELVEEITHKKVQKNNLKKAVQVLIECLIKKNWIKIE